MPADRQLADELGISISAVKKAWRAVYDRAAAILSDASDHRSQDDTKRGREKKNRLLAYLREHGEELRPVLPHERKKLLGRRRHAAEDLINNRLRVIWPEGERPSPPCVGPVRPLFSYFTQPIIRTIQKRLPQSVAVARDKGLSPFRP
jgi:hypothetical protein